jgi:hypothetical protein
VRTDEPFQTAAFASHTTRLQPAAVANQRDKEERLRLRVFFFRSWTFNGREESLPKFLPSQKNPRSHFNDSGPLCPCTSVSVA